MKKVQHMSHMAEGSHLRHLQRIGSLMRSRGNVSAALEERFQERRCHSVSKTGDLLLSEDLAGC
jgi:hypothetical protein